MNDTGANNELDLAELDEARSGALRRLRLISLALVLGLGLAASMYAWQGNWSVGRALGVAMAVAVAVYWLANTGHAGQAGKLLLASCAALCAWLMWAHEGLRDVMVLGFSVVLVLSGLLASVRFFFTLLLLILGFLTALWIATETGWRVDTPPSPLRALLRDQLVILAVGGFAVYITLLDLHRTRRRLRDEVARVRASEERLAYLSAHDRLTGLPNRDMGRERIGQILAQGLRDGRSAALLFVDLDNFKAINDTLGHEAGDAYLVETSKRLRGGLRGADVVCRHGGDEFVVGLAGLNEAADVCGVAETLLGALLQPVSWQGTEIASSCSIGVAIFPSDGGDYETLLRHADLAMYKAKEDGRNTYRFYEEQMNADLRQERLLVTELRASLGRREFVLHYQPVIDLASGRLSAVEALVRWQRDDELVPPGRFIPAMERSGLIVELGRWVLDEACAQIARWRAEGHTALVVAVNVSAVQFRRGHVVEVVAEALRESGVPAHCLELEITESTLADKADVFVATLERLKALGVSLSIDDFGTGYSNLAYLQRFAVHKLKIDRSFVLGVEEDLPNRTIVAAIIQMARALNLETIAEGIEAQAAMDALRRAGCTFVQGYFCGRPESAEEIGKRLREEQGRAALPVPASLPEAPVAAAPAAAGLGAASFCPDGRWARLEIAGPFDMDGLLAFERARAEQLAQWRPAARWVALTHWHRSMLMDPETLAHFARGTQAFFARLTPAPLAIAWVAGAEVEGRLLLSKRFETIYAEAGVPFRIFSDEAEAERWLDAVLAAT